MKYLCLGYHEDKKWQAMSDHERQTLLEESAAYDDLLRQKGNYIDRNLLKGAQTAITLRFASGRMDITEGPFVETKEQLGVVLVLEARDLNHAIQLTSQLPCMRMGGSLEIRPINEELYELTGEKA